MVAVDGVESDHDPLPILSDVLQGSLELLLFLIYINDLPSVLEDDNRPSHAPESFH